MTTVYIPRPIRTVEDAEGLPEGTIVRRDGEYPLLRVNAHFFVGGDGRYALHSSDAIGWTALVPVEAEEETCSIQTRGQEQPDWRTRLVTPWVSEAES